MLSRAQNVEILVARTTEEIEEAYTVFANDAAIGCDTETTSLSARHGKILSVQFSDGEFSVLVPTSEGVSLGRLGDLFEDERIIKIFHNAKFDLEFLRERGHSVTNVFDTMIAEKVLTKGAGQSVSLAETLYRYFAVDLDKSQRSKFNKNFNGIWTDDLVDYALSDVVYLPLLMHEQIAWLERIGLSEDYRRQMQKIF